MTDMQRLARFVATFDAHGLAGLADLPYNDVVGVFDDLRKSIDLFTDLTTTSAPPDDFRLVPVEGDKK